MPKQQAANAHGRPREGQPLLHKRRGPAARRALRLPPVQPTRGELLCSGTQPAWKHLGHSEIEELIKVLQGHGGNTCSDLFRDLDPYLRENRSLKSTCRTSKCRSGRQEAEGIRQPAQQTARRTRLCTEDEEALVRRLQKKREELEELEDKLFEVEFRAICSSLDDSESPRGSRGILRDAPSPTLEPAAGPSESQSACSGTKDAAGEAPKCSQLETLDQLLAELCPDGSDDSLSCNALVKELLEDWEQEELPNREAAEGRDSEPESSWPLHPQDEEQEPAASDLDSDPCSDGHSEPLPTPLPKEAKVFAGCPSPADAVEEADTARTEAGRAQPAPPQEKPCEAEPPAGPCPEPAQPPARRVPACPAGSAAVPQPPAPRRWRSAVKSARRALRRLFSFSCLRGQPEE